MGVWHASAIGRGDQTINRRHGDGVDTRTDEVCFKRGKRCHSGCRRKGREATERGFSDSHIKGAIETYVPYL